MNKIIRAIVIGTVAAGAVLGIHSLVPTPEERKEQERIPGFPEAQCAFPQLTQEYSIVYAANNFPSPGKVTILVDGLDDGTLDKVVVYQLDKLEERFGPILIRELASPRFAFNPLESALVIPDGDPRLKDYEDIFKAMLGKRKNP